METDSNSKEYTGPYKHIAELIDFLKANGIDLGSTDTQSNTTHGMN
jgi:hypothetical protein